MTRPSGVPTEIWHQTKSLYPFISELVGKEIHSYPQYVEATLIYFKSLQEDPDSKYGLKANWIYSPKGDPTNDQIVQLLRKSNDPKLARYLYRTFGMRRTPDADFIFREMCDEYSPFYIPYVKDESLEVIMRNDNLPLFEERIKRSFFSVDLFRPLTALLKDYRNTVIGHDRVMTKEKETQFQKMIPNIIEQMMNFLK